MGKGSGSCGRPSMQLGASAASPTKADIGTSITEMVESLSTHAFFSVPSNDLDQLAPAAEELETVAQNIIETIRQLNNRLPENSGYCHDAIGHLASATNTGYFARRDRERGRTDEARLEFLSPRQAELAATMHALQQLTRERFHTTADSSIVQSTTTAVNSIAESDFFTADITSLAELEASLAQLQQRTIHAVEQLKQLDLDVPRNRSYYHDASGHLASLRNTPTLGLRWKEIGKPEEDRLERLREWHPILVEKAHALQQLTAEHFGDGRDRTPVQPQKAFDNVMKQYAAQCAENSVHVENTADVSWTMTQSTSQRVFDNLMSNALRWLPDDRERWIVLSSDGNRLYLADSGPGTDDSSIFDQGVTHHPDGTGEGLHTVRTRLQEEGLTIRLGDIDDLRTPGAVFVIEPLQQ